MDDLVPWVEPDPAGGAELLELLDTDVELPDVHPSIAGYVPSTIGEAEWAMAHLVRARAALDAVRDQHAVWQERLDAWATSEARPHTRRSAFFNHALTMFGLRRREETGSATVKLPSGTIATRAAQPRMAIEDADAVVAWAKANDHADIVKVTETVGVTAVKPHAFVASITVAHDAFLAPLAAADGEVDPVDVAYVRFDVTDPDDVPVAIGEVERETGRVVVAIQPVIEPCVVDIQGAPIPGMAVVPGGVTATVTPAST